MQLLLYYSHYEIASQTQTLHVYLLDRVVFRGHQALKSVLSVHGMQTKDTCICRKYMQCECSPFA